MSIDREDQLVPIEEGRSVTPTPSDRFTARKIMERSLFDPIQKMIDLSEQLEERDDATGVPLNAELRLKIYSTLAKYYAPAPKSVDVNIQSNESRTITVVDFTGYMESRKEYIPQQYRGPQLQGATEVVDVDYKPAPKPENSSNGVEPQTEDTL